MIIRLSATLAVSLVSLVSFGCSSSKDLIADAGSEAARSAPSDRVATAARAACAYDAGAPTIDTQGASKPDGTNIPIDTIVIVMMENRSFDHYFQDLPNTPGWKATDVDVAPPGAWNPGIDGTHVPFAHGTQLCFADTNHGWDGTHQEIHNGMMC